MFLLKLLALLARVFGVAWRSVVVASWCLNILKCLLSSSVAGAFVAYLLMPLCWHYVLKLHDFNCTACTESGECSRASEKRWQHHSAFYVLHFRSGCI